MKQNLVVLVVMSLALSTHLLALQSSTIYGKHVLQQQGKNEAITRNAHNQEQSLVAETETEGGKHKIQKNMKRSGGHGGGRGFAGGGGVASTVHHGPSKRSVASIKPGPLLYTPILTFVTAYIVFDLPL